MTHSMEKQAKVKLDTCYFGKAISAVTCLSNKCVFLYNLTFQSVSHRGSWVQKQELKACALLGRTYSCCSKGRSPVVWGGAGRSGSSSERNNNTGFHP